MPEPDPPDPTARRVHRPEQRAGVHVTARPPFGLVDRAVEARRDLSVGTLGRLHRRAVSGHRLEELDRRLAPDPAVGVAQVQPVEPVPDHVHPRVVPAAEPPEPIASFRDQDLAAGLGQLLGIRLSGRLVDGFVGGDQALPGPGVLRVACPGFEVAVDPRPGHDPGQPLTGGVGLEEAGDGGQLQLLCRAEPPVELVEESVPVLLVEIPAVLAVQGDRDQKRRTRILTLPDGMQTGQQVGNRLLRLIVLVIEADQVGEAGIAKDDVDRPPLPLQPVRQVEEVRTLDPVSVSADGAVEGPVEHALIARQPEQAVLLGQECDLVAQGQLGRPQPLGSGPEEPAMSLHRQAQLLGGVLGMGEGPVGQLDRGRRRPGGVEVPDEGQDGMVEGARGQLRLAAFAQRPVRGQHPAHGVELGGDDRLLVLLGEVAAPGQQLADRSPAFHRVGVDPGEVGPDLKVAQLRIREESGQLGLGPRRGLLPLAHQLQVAGEATHPPVAAGIREPAGHEGPFLFGQIAGRAAGQVEVEVGGVARQVVLDLGAERGHQVEGLDHAGIAVQERRHPVVILDAAQADPGQEDGIGQVILVIGLVHVPDEGHMQRRGHGRLVYFTRRGCRRASPGGGPSCRRIEAGASTRRSAGRRA